MTLTEMLSREYDVAERAALDDLTHGTDGPLTPFVVIARAVEAARAGRFTSPDKVNDPLANALAKVLAGFAEDER